jgi:hypothetical protein
MKQARGVHQREGRMLQRRECGERIGQAVSSKFLRSSGRETSAAMRDAGVLRPKSCSSRKPAVAAFEHLMASPYTSWQAYTGLWQAP